LAAAHAPFLSNLQPTPAHESGLMKRNVFAGSKLTLRAQITDGNPKDPKAVFVVTEDGSEAARAEGEVEGGSFVPGTTAVHVHEISMDFPEGKESYPLEYKVEVDGKEFRGTEEYEVWPYKISLEAVDADGKPVPLFPFDVVKDPGGGGAAAPPPSGASDKPARWATREDGTAVGVGTAPGPQVILPGGAHRIVKYLDGKEKGPKRKAEVELNFPKGVISSTPAEAGKPIRQFVNLATQLTDDARKGQDRHGSVLHLTVGRKSDKLAPGASPPAADAKFTATPAEKVYFRIEFTAATKATPPDPRVLDAEDLQVEEDGDRKTHKGHVKIGDNGAGVLKVDLGVVGGDTCTIQVGGNELCQDDTVEIVNWRKLMYQVTRPGNTPMPSMDRITKALAQTFVDYEKYKDVPLEESDVPSGPLSWFPGEWLDAPGEKLLNVGDVNKTHFHAKFVDTHTPIGVHVMGCHTQYDADGSNTEQSFTDLEVTKTSLIAWSTGQSVPGREIWVGRGIFPKAFKDGSDALISGSWKEVGGSGAGTLTTANIWYQSGAKHGRVGIRIPTEAKNLVDVGKKVALTVKFRVAKGPYLGEADHPDGWKQLIVIRMAESSVNDVMAHELGHTMKQVVKSVPPGLAASDHGRQYTGNGHQGPHCADGMSDENYAGGAGKAGSDYEGDFTGAGECKCLMYGENSSKGSKSSGQFCARCRPFIQAQDLSTLH